MHSEWQFFIFEKKKTGKIIFFTQSLLLVSIGLSKQKKLCPLRGAKRNKKNKQWEISMIFVAYRTYESQMHNIVYYNHKGLTSKEKSCKVLRCTILCHAGGIF